MSTWEERMAARHGGMNAKDRRIVIGGLTDEEQREFDQRKRENGFTLVDGRWFKPEPPEGPDYCRDCCDWDPHEGIYTVTCGLFTLGLNPGCRFGHAHHDDELWMA